MIDSFLVLEVLIRKRKRLKEIRTLFYFNLVLLKLKQFTLNFEFDIESILSNLTIQGKRIEKANIINVVF